MTDEPTPLDTAGMRRYHREHLGWCFACGFRWPCDAIRLADALDRLTAERDAEIATAKHLQADRESVMALNVRAHREYEKTHAGARMWPGLRMLVPWFYERIDDLEGEVSALRTRLEAAEGLLRNFLNEYDANSRIVAPDVAAARAYLAQRAGKE
jgi:hypothetical protein